MELRFGNKVQGGAKGWEPVRFSGETRLPCERLGQGSIGFIKKRIETNQAPEIQAMGKQAQAVFVLRMQLQPDSHVMHIFVFASKIDFHGSL